MSIQTLCYLVLATIPLAVVAGMLAATSTRVQQRTSILVERAGRFRWASGSRGSLARTQLAAGASGPER